jgi:RING finger/CHY zinc finger protein 1
MIFKLETEKKIRNKIVMSTQESTINREQHEDEDDENWTSTSEVSDDEEEQSAEENVKPGLGCSHYRRNCQLKAPCCGRFFWCRFCHNDDVQQQSIAKMLKKIEQVSCPVEEMARNAVQVVKCMKCQHEQQLTESNFRNCENCGVEFAKYACFKCKLYNNDPAAQIYHCDECGICRVGSREKYTHCSACGTCMQQNHKCVRSKVLEDNCGVCLEYLFTSRRPSTLLPNCGHAVHADCYSQLIRSNNLSCPLCSASLLEKKELTGYYSELDRIIEQHPLPDEFKGKKSNILCNDCLKKNTVDFHFYGHKCTDCGSYNTRVI